MVLTRRQHRAISRWLPNEVIVQIIEAAPREDRATLCRVSKLFQGLAVPVMYRVVHLRRCSRADVRAFCLALLSNPALAELVRSLTVQLNGMDPIYVPVSDLMLRSFKTLLRLEHLSIDDHLWAGEDFDSFLRYTYPRLVSCDVGCKRATLDATVSFLIRHPTLTRICIVTWNGFELTAPTPIRLPNLRYYQGPHQLIPWLETGGLEEVALDWRNFRPSSVEATIVLLKSMVPTGDPIVCSNIWCNGPGPFTEIIDSLSRNISHMKTLQVHLRELLDNGKEQIACLKKHLPRLNGLKFLSFYLAADWAFTTSGAIGRVTVEAFGDLCPTLEACRTGYKAWRKVDGTWQEYPLADYCVLAGIRFGFP
ncbi:hypothetical protein B0H11DRAFT_1253805 [Mycena galericulata]|nr:hypothetical protein B0H11DRAFT_1253805 [Mycena galericulata]